MRRYFQVATRDLQLELRVPGPSINSALEPLASEFHIARANIHITSLYIQSVLLENVIHVQLLPALCAESHHRMPSDTEILLKRELWKYRSAIARDLLAVLEHIPKQTLERNSFAFVLAIRKVASTLLDPDGDMAIPDYMKEEVMTDSYVQQFAEILVPLDCNAPLSLRR
ncbi:uncharacterized protein BDV17DRAFT_288434 [Aspergillus undulatus]|uniref:uncharacterized protein n=1 Tax=Aspergillus undulatus TaxID=1810928 RepID=UPI003CCD7FE6